MSDPIRLIILKALTLALSEINTSTGYENDLRPDVEFPKGKVFRGRAVYSETDPLPMVTLLETPVPVELIGSRGDNTGSYGGWEIIIQGFVKDDFDNPTDPAHLLMADVKRRIAIEKRRTNDAEAFGIREITGIELGAGVVRPPDQTSDKAYFWLSLNITFAEELTEPYG